MTLTYRINPPVDNAVLNDLFAAAWPDHHPCDFVALLRHALAYVCAYDGEHLLGFVKLAWDGGVHAFLLDTTVHPDARHRGIGQELVRQAAEAARAHQIEWIHVDYEPHLHAFYTACGFRPTLAGLINLSPA